MNRTIFWRVFWKEYRLQRALWLAMALLTSLMLVLVNEFTIDPKERIGGLFWAALAFSAFYCLGCGATLFAGEREAETYEFQRTLPVRAGWVFAGKFGFALFSSSLFFGLMWLLAAFLSGWDVSPPKQVALWTLLGLFGLELLLWTVFVSLLTRRVLPTAILGATAAALSLAVMVNRFGQNAVMQDCAVAIMWQRAMLAVLLFLVDVWLGTRWFRQRSDRRRYVFRSFFDVDFPSEAVIGDHLPMRRVIARLAWQHWLQSKWMITSVVALFFVMIGFPMSLSGHPMLPIYCDLSFRAQVITLIPLVICSLVGLCAFAGDQRRKSYRFLADRGVSPNHVWLSRQIHTMAIPMMLVVGPTLIAIPLSYSLQYTPTDFMWFNIIASLIFTITFVAIAIAAGQLCSLFVASGFLAGVCSLIVTAFLWAWCWLMLAWHVNWLWSILPIPLTMLLATWLRTPYWLLERNDWRAWLPSGVTLAVPTFVILVCVAFHRACEIPLVDPGFSPEEFNCPATIEELSTLDLYQRAIQRLTPGNAEKGSNADDAWYNKVALTARDIAWVNANEDVIGLVVKASRGKIHLTESGMREQTGMLTLGKLMIDRAVMLEKQKKLDATLDCLWTAIRISQHLRNLDGAEAAGCLEMSAYAHLSAWARQPGQSPERIAAAVRQLQQLTLNISTIDRVKFTYLRMRRVIEGDPDTMGHENVLVSGFAGLWPRLPWERERALRLLNEQTRAQLTSLSRMEAAIRNGEGAFSWASPPEPSSHLWQGRISSQPLSLLEIVIRGVPTPYDFLLRVHVIKRDYMIQVTSCHAVQLILGLEACKLQRGSLPKTLDELVGRFLDRLPVDPCSGEPFRYFREGIKGPLPPAKFQWPYVTTRTSDRAMAPNTPFFWSTGLEVRRVSHSGDILSQYLVCAERAGMALERAEDWRKPSSTYDIWISGWPFPIP